jgi:hypothetical protein
MCRAAGAGKTDTFPGERYRRIARRRISKRAIVAVSRSIMVIACHLLADPAGQFPDLGPGFYAARIDPERRTRTRVRQFEALGYTVTFQPGARPDRSGNSAPQAPPGAAARPATHQFSDQQRVDGRLISDWRACSIRSGRR